ncbi:ribokinase [Rathayibacter sp. Leaf296]|uniref:ribokinase n=1 Tax=Rathayibacter sp. Leaf296 TaxID=1736327 RepID=UPI000702F975|nr:ribokinase [Rathayibacter sp. Leaf296]KQQ08250.1 hypothetical protein ASF46_13035 [Rathayibacter sp. Leaf296]
MQTGTVPVDRPRPHGRVVAVGSLNADLLLTTDEVPQAGRTVYATALHRAPGGKSANQAVAAARLGATVSLIGAVGSDENGRALMDAALAAGVDVSGVTTLQGVDSGVAVILVEPGGENRILVVGGANRALDSTHVSAHAESLRSAQAVGLSFEVADAPLTTAARIARDAGAIVVLNPSPVRPLTAELADCVSVLVVNQHELQAVVGDSTDAARALRTDELAGLEALVVTRGPDGADVVQRTSSGGITTTRVPSVEVDAVDTTGCGDAFLGALLAGLSSGWTLVASARIAAMVAARAATISGAQPSYPTWADLLREHAAPVD